MFRELNIDARRIAWAVARGRASQNGSVHAFLAVRLGVAPALR